ncbi:hypothetical protein LCGC14_2141310 [marine sediment metagenome]|uniref:Uncharacterized protein n=1 Tax=marine sediment metagenome TaxID=412755 RepID=A0A0F9EKM3_9ZZZZ
MLEIDMRNAVDISSKTTNFHVLLIRLMRKADMGNYARLKSVFPNTARVLEHWIETEEILEGVSYE